MWADRGGLTWQSTLPPMAALRLPPSPALRRSSSRPGSGWPEFRRVLAGLQAIGLVALGDPFLVAGRYLAHHAPGRPEDHRAGRNPGIGRDRRPGAKQATGPGA